MTNRFKAISKIANPIPLTKELQGRFADRLDPKLKLKVYAELMQHMAKLALSRKPIPPFSRYPETFPAFDNDEAYRVAATVASIKLRFARHSRMAVGRKIGFTNKNIWSKYNVDKSNWGYMWLDSVKHSSIRAPVFNISVAERKTGCKLEPEIVFGLESAPSSTMTDQQLLGCIRWAAHGFEVVYSPFPYWDFTLADTTAVGALHKHLFISNTTSSRRWKGQEEKFISDLQNFEIDLYRNGDLVTSGRGSNVLGSPLNALRHLCEILEKQDLHPRIQPGEIITTGTLTDAMDLNIEARWHIKSRGLDLLEGYAPLWIKMNGLMIRRGG